MIIRFCSNSYIATYNTIINCTSHSDDYTIIHNYVFDCEGISILYLSVYMCIYNENEEQQQQYDVKMRSNNNNMM